MSLFESDRLRIEMNQHVAELVLTRPEAMNPIDAQAHDDLLAAFGALVDTPELRALVLSSSGRVFSAGADFDYFRQANRSTAIQLKAIENGRRLITAFLDFPVPVVAALHGPAVGLAANLVILCDAVVACRSATLSDPHVQIGLVAGDGGCIAWPHAAGMLRARRQLLTGDPVTAVDAFAFGLVTDLVDDPEDVRAAALEIATRIAGLPPLAVRGTKQALNQLTRARANEVFELGLMLEARTLGTRDVMEAVDAFVGRRRGTYVGE